MENSDGTAATPARQADPWLSTPPVSPKKKIVLWKWSVAATGLLLAFAIWQCVSAFRTTQQQAAKAVLRFHQQMNAGDYEAILGDSDDAFRNDADQAKQLFSAVHRKLGVAGNSQQTFMNVQATTGGKFATVTFNTPFSDGGDAVETFVWRIRDG